MRALLLGAILAHVLVLAPGQAFAVCTCTCVEGNVQSLCTQLLDIAPLCQRTCPASVLPPGSRPRAPDLGPLLDGYGEGERPNLIVNGQSPR